MASVGAGGSPSGRRALDYELALVPFIDFLLCLVAFLLVTAVWSQLARLRADARVPGSTLAPSSELPLELHVSVADDSFSLRWQQGATVLDSIPVPRRAQTLPDGNVRYPELARAAGEQWRARGAHRGASDAAQDRAVLHTPNALEFREITGVLDALNAPKRRFDGLRGASEVPAFSVAFATD
jgi:hypothetical protein